MLLIIKTILKLFPQDQECSIVEDTIVENICENMDKEDCREVTKIVQDEECSKVIKQNCSDIQETNCSVIGKFKFFIF